MSGNSMKAISKSPNTAPKNEEKLGKKKSNPKQNNNNLNKDNLETKDEEDIDINQYLKEMKSQIEKNLKEQIAIIKDREGGVKEVLKNINNLLNDQNGKQKKNSSIFDLKILKKAESSIQKRSRKSKDVEKEMKFINNQKSNNNVLRQSSELLKDGEINFLETEHEDKLNRITENNNNINNIRRRVKKEGFFNIIETEYEDRLRKITDNNNNNNNNRKKVKSQLCYERGVRLSEKKLISVEKTKILLKAKELENLYDKPNLYKCPTHLKKKIETIKPLYQRYKDVIVKKELNINKIRNENSQNHHSFSKTNESNFNNCNKSHSVVMHTEINDQGSRKKRFEEWIERCSIWEKKRNQKIIQRRELKDNEEMEEKSKQNVILTSKSQIIDSKFQEKEYFERMVKHEKMKEENIKLLSKKYEYDYTPKINKTTPNYMNKVVSKVGSLASLFSQRSFLKQKKDAKTNSKLNKSSDNSVHQIRKRNQLTQAFEYVNNRKVFVSMFEGLNYHYSWKNVNENKIFYEKKYDNIVQDIENNKLDEDPNEFII
jgi:hypothetical protein